MVTFIWYGSAFVVVVAKNEYFDDWDRSLRICSMYERKHMTMCGPYSETISVSNGSKIFENKTKYASHTLALCFSFIITHKVDTIYSIHLIKYIIFYKFDSNEHFHSVSVIIIFWFRQSFRNAPASTRTYSILLQQQQIYKCGKTMLGLRALNEYGYILREWNIYKNKK